MSLIHKGNRNLIVVENEKCIVNYDNLNNINIKQSIYDNILANLKIDNIHALIQEINKNGIYQIAYWPEGGHLTENQDGTITAVFRDEKGKILQHGKLKQIGPDLVNISKALANQVMLAYIISQLKEINIKLDSIIKGQHDDRISEIEGAIKTYSYLSQEDKRDASNIVLQIRTGIAKIQREINNELRNFDPNAKFSDNWVSNKSKEVEKRYYNISECIYWIIKGYEILMDWDVIYNTKNIYNNSVEEFMQFIENQYWHRLIDISRALPYKKNDNIGFPEEMWGNMIKKRPEMMVSLKNQLYINNNNIKEYVIETNGTKLLEVLNEL